MPITLTTGRASNLPFQTPIGTPFLGQNFSPSSSQTLLGQSRYTKVPHGHEVKKAKRLHHSVLTHKPPVKKAEMRPVKRSLGLAPALISFGLATLLFGAAVMAQPNDHADQLVPLERKTDTIEQNPTHPKVPDLVVKQDPVQKTKIKRQPLKEPPKPFDFKIFGGIAAILAGLAGLARIITNRRRNTHERLDFNAELAETESLLKGFEDALNQEISKTKAEDFYIIEQAPKGTMTFRDFMEMKSEVRKQLTKIEGISFKLKEIKDLDSSSNPPNKKPLSKVFKKPPPGSR